MDKKDFLSLLSQQDTIADVAEDLGYILTIRKTTVPDEMRPELEAFLIYSDDSGNFKMWSSENLKNYISESENN